MFLSYDDQIAGDTLNVLHSLLFQILEESYTSRPILQEAYKSNIRRLKGDSDFVLAQLSQILQTLGSTFVVIDGLDELDKAVWGHLLSSLLQLHKNCPELKLLISSREERDIATQLEGKATTIRVDNNNSKDIDSYVELECVELFVELRSYGADERTCLKIKKALEIVGERAAGQCRRRSTAHFHTNFDRDVSLRETRATNDERSKIAAGH